MHSFLRAIGFGSITNRRDEENLMKLVIENASERQVFRVSEERSFIELYMEVSNDAGVVVRGEQDEEGVFHVSHYVPIHRGCRITTEETVFINKRVDTDAFTGMCEDYRIGISLIFYVQNVVDMLKCPVTKRENRKCPIYLAALATEGKILTNGEIFGRTIILAENLNESEFYEITEEEYESILKEQERKEREANAE